MVWRGIRTGSRIWEAHGPNLVAFCVLLLSWAVLGAETNAPSPTGNWVVRTWQTKDGLPQNYVYALLQTRDGYLWVGTGGGLARFDGVRFRTFGLQDGLGSVQISALVEDAQGNLWVGTRGGGVSRFEKGRFRTYSQEEGYPSSVECLGTTADGTIWIGTQVGLLKCRDGVVQKMAAKTGAPEKFIRALVEDNNRVLWVATVEGLYKGTNDRFQNVEAIPTVSTPIYSLCQDREGNIWAGSGNGNLWKLSGGACERFQRADGVPFQLIGSLAQGREGPLWIGTRAGGLHYHTDGKFQRLASNIDLSTSDVWALVVDREGMVWLGTSEGLCRLSRMMVYIYGQAEGLEHPIVNSVAQDSSGSLWLATQRGGVYQFQAGQFTSTLESSNRPQAYTILATADGSIWAAGESFLHRYRPGEETKAFTEPPIGGQAIRALCEDGPAVWLGTYYSALLRCDGTNVAVVATNGSFGGAITSLVRESADTLWIGTWNGLYHWERGKVTTWGVREGLLCANIQTLHRDPDGTLWIGTLGGGLSRLQGGRVLNITTRQGLADDVINQIAADDYGYLWLGCNRGIMRVGRRDIEDLAAGKTSFIPGALIGQNEGMLAEQCTGGHSPTALKTSGGRLVFPTVGGIVEIDPQEWRESQNETPRATIEEAKVNGQVQELASGLIIKPGHQRLELNFGAPSLRGPNSVRFRFRLQPLEGDWMNAGTRNTAYYPALRPGHYEFQVTARSREGEWNENSARLAIVVRPYFWASLWFQSLVGAGICGAAFLYSFRRMRRLEEKRATQEAFTRQLLVSQENERKRVASELHDGLGQDLLLIKNRVNLMAADTKNPPEVARQLADVSKDASRAIAEVRAISQALRPAALEQIGLTKALEWMIEQVAETSKETRFAKELDDVDGVLEPEMEINLYRIVQEALNNVMKHARASQVIVEVKREAAAGLRVSVFDNGQGFDATPAVRGRETKPGFGLAGMRERAKVLGGEIELQSTLEKGTRLTLTVPWPQPQTASS